MRVAFLLGFLLLGNVLALQRHSAHSLSVPSEAASCFYTLTLSSNTTGFRGSRVWVYLDGQLTENEGVTLPNHMSMTGYSFAVTQGAVLTASYSMGSGGSNGHEFWITDANGKNVMYGSDMGHMQSFTTSEPTSCVCTYETVCPAVRIRYEWRALSHCDQINFIAGLNKLRFQNNGTVYDKYIAIHNSFAWTLGRSGFFTWHRRLTHMFETDLRALGGRYACVSVPYWDWGLDFGAEGQSVLYEAFGGIKTNSCLSHPFESWTNPYSERLKDGCVMRRMHTDDSTDANPVYPEEAFTSSSAFQFGITSNSSFTHLSTYFCRSPHSSVHAQVAGSRMGDFLMASAPADPLFWLHHTNIDRSWALWQDCWDYDVGAPDNWASQYQDLTDEGILGIDDQFPALGGTTREILNIADLGYRYAPLVENWYQWGSNNQRCKWDWFSREQTSLLQHTTRNLDYPAHTRLRSPVHDDRQRDMINAGRKSFQNTFAETQQYELSLKAQLRSDCQLGEFESKDVGGSRDDVRSCGKVSNLGCRNLCWVDYNGYLAQYATTDYIAVNTTLVFEMPNQYSSNTPTSPTWNPQVRFFESKRLHKIAA